MKSLISAFFAQPASARQLRKRMEVKKGHKPNPPHPSVLFLIALARFRQTNTGFGVWRLNPHGSPASLEVK